MLNIVVEGASFDDVLLRLKGMPAAATHVLCGNESLVVFSSEGVASSCLGNLA